MYTIDRNAFYISKSRKKITYIFICKVKKHFFYIGKEKENQIKKRKKTHCPLEGGRQKNFVFLWGVIIACFLYLSSK